MITTFLDSVPPLFWLAHENAGLPRNPSMYISQPSVCRQFRAFQAAYALHRSKARPAPESLRLHHDFNLNHMGLSENVRYRDTY